MKNLLCLLRLYQGETSNKILCQIFVWNCYKWTQVNNWGNCNNKITQESCARNKTSPKVRKKWLKIYFVPIAFFTNWLDVLTMKGFFLYVWWTEPCTIWEQNRSKYLTLLAKVWLTFLLETKVKDFIGGTSNYIIVHWIIVYVVCLCNIIA